MCTHPHATAWLLHNFTGRHLMLEIDMDKTIVTKGRGTGAFTAHIYTQAMGTELLNLNVMNQGSKF